MPPVDILAVVSKESVRLSENIPRKYWILCWSPSSKFILDRLLETVSLNHRRSTLNPHWSVWRFWSVQGMQLPHSWLQGAHAQSLACLPSACSKRGDHDALVRFLDWLSKPQPEPLPSSPSPTMQNYFASSINLDKVEPANNAVAEFETNTHTIHAVASARLYHTQLNVKNCEWSYSRLKGTLSFGRDWSSKGASQSGAQDAEKYWFSLVDKDTGRTVWMFKIPLGLDYQVDRPFFHVFQGRVCLRLA